MKTHITKNYPAMAIAAGITVAALGLFPLTGFAATPLLGGVQSTVGISATQNSGIDVTAGANVTSDDGMDDGSAGMSASGSSDDQYNSNAPDQAASEQGAVVMTRDDFNSYNIANGSDSSSGTADASGRQTVNADTVSSRDDLSAYERSMMQNDSNVRSVSMDGSQVSVSYKVHAKFLGFIPSSITSRVTVNADGSTQVSYPWYRFLMSAEAKAKVQSDVQSHIKAQMISGASQLDLQTQAEIASDIQASMSAEYNK